MWMWTIHKASLSSVRAMRHSSSSTSRPKIMAVHWSSPSTPRALEVKSSYTVPTSCSCCITVISHEVEDAIDGGPVLGGKAGKQIGCRPLPPCRLCSTTTVRDCSDLTERCVSFVKTQDFVGARRSGTAKAEVAPMSSTSSPATVNARLVAGSTIMAPRRIRLSTQMRSRRVGASTALSLTSNTLRTSPCSMSSTRSSWWSGKDPNRPTMRGPAWDLCTAAKAGAEMRARHALDTHRNRQSAFTGSLTSTSKMMSSGSDTPLMTCSCFLLRFGSIVCFPTQIHFYGRSPILDVANDSTINIGWPSTILLRFSFPYSLQHHAKNKIFISNHYNL